MKFNSKLKYFLVFCKELSAYVCRSIVCNLNSNRHGVGVTTKVCTNTVTQHKCVVGIEHARISQPQGGLASDTNCSK